MLAGIEFKDNWYALMLAIFTNESVSEALSDMGINPYAEEAI